MHFSSSCVRNIYIYLKRNQSSRQLPKSSMQWKQLDVVPKYVVKFISKDCVTAILSGNTEHLFHSKFQYCCYSKSLINTMSLIIILRKKETRLCTGPRKTFMKIIVFYVKIYNNEKKAKIYRIFFKNLQYSRKLRKKRTPSTKLHN